MTIHALDKNFYCKEIPVEYRDRPAGSVSKLNTVQDGIRVLKTIWQLVQDYRPLMFFGTLGGLSFLVGLLFFIPVLNEFFKTGLVLRFPTLIVSVGLMTIGILFYMVGLVLSVIAKKHRLLYELMLNQYK